jgi:glucose-6-phosphate isomerase
MFLLHNLTAALGPLHSTEEEVHTRLQAATPQLQKMVERIQAGDLPAFKSSLTEDVAPLQTMLAGWRKRFDHVLILGMGGSSLGGRLIDHFMDTVNLAPPRLHFVDFLAPCGLASLARLPLDRTGVVVISKSGGTLETLAQALHFAQAYEAADYPLAEHWLVVTEEKTSPLRALAQAHNLPVLPHHPQLGGRFSVVAETGIIPLLLKGGDVGKFRRGLREQAHLFLHDPLHAAPSRGAALHALAAERGCGLHVLYAYGERLRFLPAWHEQLWGESLGKNGRGTTPLGAVGPGSQHSLQQLFLDGPADKLFTLILPCSAGWGDPLPAQDASPVLAGVPPGTLQQAMGEGTYQALQARGRPVRLMQLRQLDETALGSLLMHFMLETVVTACLWAVDPFDQPAVEESKKSTLEALARLG